MSIENPKDYLVGFALGFSIAALIAVLLNTTS